MSNRQTAFLYFDAGFTLIRPTRSVGHHYAEVACRHGIEADPERLDAAFVASWRAAISPELRQERTPAYGRTLDEARVFWSRIVVETFRRAGSEVPESKTFQKELFDRFAGGSAWELFPDAEEALTLASDAGLPIGILSNWDPRLRPVLRDMGLDARFSRIVLSCEIGYEKPHPAIFEAARQIAGGHPPMAFGIIGDDAEADGVGGRDAGWRACQVIRRGQDSAPAGVHAASNLVDAVTYFLA